MRSIWVALVLGLAVQAQEGSPPPLPPPGKLIDIGGWRLHLNCTGTRSAQAPLVILEPGIGDFSVEWSLVQPEVAKTARVCSYDRAGDGWSEMGPHPRTFQQIVYELHTLLDRAGERPPLRHGWTVLWRLAGAHVSRDAIRQRSRASCWSMPARTIPNA